MKTLNFLPFKAIGGFEGKIIKYQKEDIQVLFRLSRTQTSADSAARIYCAVSVIQNLKFLVGRVF